MWDERLIHVKKEPLPDGTGFSLEVTPKMDNIPPGSRLPTILGVQTDVPSEENLEVQVQAINLVEAPR
jgi:hypothetical protein